MSNPPEREPIDVVIPVHDAPELVRRCVTSCLDHLGAGLGGIFLQDDASGPETVALLRSLAGPRVHVERFERNRGFGATVNAAFARTRSSLVLVLNSDTEASDDFLLPLAAAHARDERLAAVVPAGNTFRNYDLSRYRTRAGCVVCYDLRGYAFLVKRRAFEEAGGFDPVYGRGYFEDNDLSRRWWRAGWWTGVCPDSRLHHEIHGSFDGVADAATGRGRNREIYFERWPGATRNVVLAAGRGSLHDVSGALRDEIDAVLQAGGRVRCLSPDAPRGLLGIEMRSESRVIGPALRLLRSRSRRAHRGPSEIWLGPRLGWLATALLSAVARRAGIPVKRF